MLQIGNTVTRKLMLQSTAYYNVCQQAGTLKIGNGAQEGKSYHF